jgi:hypothetical protein
VHSATQFTYSTRYRWRPGYGSRCSDLLWDGRSGGSYPDRGEIFCTRPNQPWGPPTLPNIGRQVIPGCKTDGAWRYPVHPFNAEVKEKELYFFFTLCVFMTGYWVTFISTGVPMLAVKEYGSGNLIFGTRWTWVVSFTVRTFYPRGRPPLMIDLVSGWALELFWTFWRIEKFLAHIGNRTTVPHPSSL